MDDFPGAMHGVLVFGEEPQHLLRRLQVTIRVAFFLKAGFIDCRVKPNAGDDILQHAARCTMIENVVRCDRRDTRLCRRRRNHAQPCRLIGQEAAREGAIGPVTEDAAQSDQLARQFAREIIGQQDCQQPFVPRLQIILQARRRRARRKSVS
jgi:hypothetical protein